MTTIKVYAVLLVVLGCGVSFSPNMLLYTVIHCLEVFAGFAILISGVVYSKDDELLHLRYLVNIVCNVIENKSL